MSNRSIQLNCRSIINLLYHIFFQIPHDEDGWRDIAKVFQCRWHYPNCIGALDGKHVRIKKPDNAGSTFFNYKGFHSIVLMALVSGNYEFTFIDVGGEGHHSDGGIWRHCGLKYAIHKGTVNVPPSRILPGADVPTEYHIVGDDAFPLGPNLMKPYAKRNMTREERIFNYRLSRARRVSENAFGILATRFGIFKTEIDAHPDKVATCVAACCCLHNMLRRRCGRAYIPPGSIDTEDANQQLVPGEWRRYTTLTKLKPTDNKNTPAFSKQQRNVLKEYFVSPAGEVPWQYDMF